MGFLSSRVDQGAEGKTEILEILDQKVKAERKKEGGTMWEI